MLQTLGKLGKPLGKSLSTAAPKNFPKFTCRIFLQKKTHTHRACLTWPWRFLYALAKGPVSEKIWPCWHLRKQFMLEKLVAFAAFYDFTLWRCAAFVTWKYRLEIEMNIGRMLPGQKTGLPTKHRTFEAVGKFSITVFFSKGGNEFKLKDNKRIWSPGQGKISPSLAFLPFPAFSNFLEPLLALPGIVFKPW